MRTKSELRAEVRALLDTLDDELEATEQRLEALGRLYNKGIDLWERLGAGAADRDTVEVVGAWMDETRLDG